MPLMPQSTPATERVAFQHGSALAKKLTDLCQAFLDWADATRTLRLVDGKLPPITQARLRAAVELFFAHWDDLAVRKSQTGTHIPPYGIAPYYFLFGHVYCAQAIEHLDDVALRESLREKMRAVLAKSREEDGSWNDRQFGRSGGYGTALALLTMYMPRWPMPEPWQPSAAKK